MRKSNLILFSALLCALGIAGIANSQQHAGGQDPADARELYNYTLSMDKINQAATATRALSEHAKQHPELNQSPGDDSINATVERIEKYPEAAAAIHSAGLSPHEYVVCPHVAAPGIDGGGDEEIRHLQGISARVVEADKQVQPGFRRATQGRNPEGNKQPEQRPVSRRSDSGAVGRGPFPPPNSTPEVLPI